VTRWDAGELELIPNAEAEHRFFVRVQGRSEAQKEQIREAFGFRGTPLKFIIRERKEK